MEAKETQKAVSYGRPPEFYEVEALRDDVEEDDRAQEICLTSLGKRVGEGSGWQDNGKKAKGKGSWICLWSQNEDKKSSWDK